MLTELPQALEKASSFLRFSEDQSRSPLSLQDYEFITKEVTDSFHVVSCFLALFKLSPKTKQEILKVSECCPRHHRELIDKAFYTKDPKIFLTVLESYLEEKQYQYFGPNTKKDFIYTWVESFASLLLTTTKMNVKFIDALIQNNYKDEKSKSAAMKVLLLNLELSFIDFMPVAMGSSSYFDFLDKVIAHINNLSPYAFESNDDTLKFFYGEKSEGKCFIMNGKGVPFYFLDKATFHKVDENLASNGRWGRSRALGFMPLSLNNPKLSLEDILNYVNESSDPNWTELSRRAVLDWGRFWVQDRDLQRLSKTLDKYPEKFLEFLLNNTTGSSLYLNWVIIQSKRIMGSKKELSISCEDFGHFIGLNRFCFIKRNLNDTLISLFLKVADESFKEERVHINTLLCQLYPLTVPEELKGHALEEWRAKSINSKEKLEEISKRGYRDEDQVRELYEKHQANLTTFNKVRSRALTSKNIKTRMLASLKGGAL